MSFLVRLFGRGRSDSEYDGSWTRSLRSRPSLPILNYSGRSTSSSDESTLPSLKFPNASTISAFATLRRLPLWRRTEASPGPLKGLDLGSIPLYDPQIMQININTSPLLHPQKSDNEAFTCNPLLESKTTIANHVSDCHDHNGYRQVEKMRYPAASMSSAIRSFIDNHAARDDGKPRSTLQSPGAASNLENQPSRANPVGESFDITPDMRASSPRKPQYIPLLPRSGYLEQVLYGGESLKLDIEGVAQQHHGFSSAVEDPIYPKQTTDSVLGLGVMKEAGYASDDEKSKSACAEDGRSSFQSIANDYAGADSADEGDEQLRVLTIRNKSPLTRSSASNTPTLASRRNEPHDHVHAVTDGASESSPSRRPSKKTSRIRPVDSTGGPREPLQSVEAMRYDVDHGYNADDELYAVGDTENTLENKRSYGQGSFLQLLESAKDSKYDRTDTQVATCAKRTTTPTPFAKSGAFTHFDVNLLMSEYPTSDSGPDFDCPPYEHTESVGFNDAACVGISQERQPSRILSVQSFKTLGKKGRWTTQSHPKLITSVSCESGRELELRNSKRTHNDSFESKGRMPYGNFSETQPHRRLLDTNDKIKGTWRKAAKIIDHVFGSSPKTAPCTKPTGENKPQTPASEQWELKSMMDDFNSLQEAQDSKLRSSMDSCTDNGSSFWLPAYEQYHNEDMTDPARICYESYSKRSFNAAMLPIFNSCEDNENEQWVRGYVTPKSRRSGQRSSEWANGLSLEEMLERTGSQRSLLSRRSRSIRSMKLASPRGSYY